MAKVRQEQQQLQQKQQRAPFVPTAVSELTRLTRGISRRLQEEHGVSADDLLVPGASEPISLGRPRRSAATVRAIGTAKKLLAMAEANNGGVGASQLSDGEFGPPRSNLVSSYNIAAISGAEGSEGGGRGFGSGGGYLRCVCDTCGISPKDNLLQCTKCRNWCHLVCVGLTGDVSYVTRTVGATFVCPFCSTKPGTKRKRVPEPATQQTMRLSEVPDRDPPPAEAALYDRIAAAAVALAGAWGYDLISFPQTEMTDAHITDGMKCCASAIAAATFSQSYPLYCFKEQQQQAHGFVQGAMLRHRATQAVASVVFSNGMDPYGNLKQSLSQLRSAITRHRNANIGSGNAAASQLLGFTKQHAELPDVKDCSEFVHFTLVATLDEYRGRGLAKLLMCYDTVRWLRRGRTKAYVNMALDKPTKVGVDCLVPAASSHLYAAFGFFSVFPRAPGDMRVTPKEADVGRALVNLNVAPAALRVAEGLGLLKPPAPPAAGAPAAKARGKVSPHPSPRLPARK